MSDQVESPKELGDKPEDIVKRWLREIELAGEHEKKWRERSQKIIDLYRDEKERAENTPSYRFNILYANTEVLKGALYSQVPSPDCRRRFLDKDPVGRIGAQVLQRALSYSIDAYDFDEMMRGCVEDMVLPGRGVARIKYVPTMSNGEVVYEEVQCEYVEWDMYRYSPAKRWSKVRWVAFGELLTRDDLVKQFPDVGQQVKLNWMPKGMAESDENQLFKRALVWKVWNKSDRKVYIVCKGYEAKCLDIKPDPLQLEGFFPCPRPIYDISNTLTLIPVPEYSIYQDQAIQLEELSERVAVLTNALRRRGVYDASQPKLAELAEVGDNKFVPIENYREFAEKGGLEAAFQELDIAGLAKVLLELTEQVERKKAAIYELIGLSDIMRGTSKANETLGAQQLKSQYGEIRIGPRQGEVQRFARDLMRMKGEIIAEHFSPKTLAMMTGFDLFHTEAEKMQILQMMQPPPQIQGAPPAPPPQLPPGLDPEKLKKPSWEQIMGMLKSDKLRGFRIDIETDSTVKPQADEEQKNRIDLLTACSSFLEKAIPAVQGGMMPQKVATELLMFGVRAFKTGPQLEETLDQWADEAGKQQPPNMAAIEQQAQQMAEKEKELQGLQKEATTRMDQAKAAEQQAKDAAASVDAAQKELNHRVEVANLQKQVGDSAAVQAAKDAAANAQKANDKLNHDAVVADLKQQVSASQPPNNVLEEKRIQAEFDNKLKIDLATRQGLIDITLAKIAANQQAQTAHADGQAKEAKDKSDKNFDKLMLETMAQLAEAIRAEKTVSVARQSDGSLQGTVTLQ